MSNYQKPYIQNKVLILIVHLSEKLVIEMLLMLSTLSKVDVRRRRIICAASKINNDDDIVAVQIQSTNCRNKFMM